MSSISKTPPSLSGSKSYDDWVNLVSNWRKFPSLEPEKQEPVIVLSLEGESQDGVLELDSDIISGKDGVDKVIARLNKVYKKDELTQNVTPSNRLKSIRDRATPPSVISSLNLKNASIKREAMEL